MELIWLFISTGLFLGWSLGANHAVNVFGTAVTSRMVRFSTAAIVAGVFVTLGATISGAGASRTLNELGGVNALPGCATVALAVAVAVTWMTKLKLPVSTSQAVVGGIIGWNLFTGSPTDIESLTKIVSTWVLCPLLAALFGFVLYKATKFVLVRARLHMLRQDAYTRMGMIVVGAFASYSLGANNIANVVGMFVPATPFQTIAPFGGFSITGSQQLFFIGGIAIAIGVYTYGYRVMMTVGNDLYKTTPITGLLVVLAESLVLFLFASEGLERWLISHNLPSLPLVPLSSTQVVIGAVMGVGWAKGGRGLNYKVLGKIGIGWLTAPIVSASLCFIGLFFVQNVFELKVVQTVTYRVSPGVVRVLAREGIDEEPMERLSNKTFSGSAVFRHALWAEHRWTEDELHTIFSYAALDSLHVDSVLAHQPAVSRELTPGQLGAVLRLHGASYSHRWELNEALQEQSEEWKSHTGHGASYYNKVLRRNKDMLYKLFHVGRSE